MLNSYPVPVRVLIAVCLIPSLLSCDHENNEVPDSATSRLDMLVHLASGSDPVQRQMKLDSVWNSWESDQQIPFTSDTSVLFLYRGDAESVSWNGDFNRWGNDTAFNNDGSRIDSTNIWYLFASFPEDARLDYKIVVDGEWILDPANPNQQWSGHGPNSQLSMPSWMEDPRTLAAPDVSKGSISPMKFIESQRLGYTVGYRVYKPVVANNDAPLPVLYVTDGHEYLDMRLGALTRVADHLMHEERTDPFMMVFVYPTDPGDPAKNRRAEEFAMNPSYLQFFTDELIPEIDKQYLTMTGPQNRGILGTSLGGLNATYFAFSRPDLFGKAAIQSPAYWYREQIFELVENYQGKAPDLFVSTGTIGDGTSDARRMRTLFRQKNVSLRYLEVPEGHSWGAWRAQGDDILIGFFGK